MVIQMADEYIDKVEVGAKIQIMCIRREMDYGGENEFCRGMRKALRVIENMPAADVQPVKRGKWIENTYKYIKELDAYFVQAKCTVCGRYSDKIDIYTGYMSNECCSHCGAKMDLKDGDTE